MSLTPAQLRKEARGMASKKRAETNKWFFKTDKGGYGEGDLFMGLTMPQQRALAKKYKDMSLSNAVKLLHSKTHEERAMALIIMIHHFQSGDEVTKKKVYQTYLKETAYINNWDLVDISSYQIVGTYLLDRSSKKLDQLAKSRDLWEKRIAIVSTFAFIRKGRLDETIRIAKILVNDNHDLIHKAVGWMLREVGKKDVKVLEKFLKQHYETMPRTMLRYALEKFSETKRKRYLRGLV